MWIDVFSKVWLIDLKEWISNWISNVYSLGRIIWSTTVFMKWDYCIYNRGVLGSIKYIQLLKIVNYDFMKNTIAWVLGENDTILDAEASTSQHASVLLATCFLFSISFANTLYNIPIDSLTFITLLLILAFARAMYGLSYVEGNISVLIVNYYSLWWRKK